MIAILQIADVFGTIFHYHAQKRKINKFIDILEFEK